MKIALFNIISSDDAICKHIVAVISNGFPVYPIYFAHRTLFPVIIIIIYPAVCFAILAIFVILQRMPYSYKYSVLFSLPLPASLSVAGYFLTAFRFARVPDDNSKLIVFCKFTFGIIRAAVKLPVFTATKH